jgi:hypothetical protein
MFVAYLHTLLTSNNPTGRSHKERDWGSEEAIEHHRFERPDVREI